MIVTNHVNWHRENLRQDRVNTGNLKMQFELVWGLPFSTYAPKGRGGGRGSSLLYISIAYYMQKWVVSKFMLGIGFFFFRFLYVSFSYKISGSVIVSTSPPATSRWHYLDIT